MSAGTRDLAVRLGEAAVARGALVATAESCTGGGIAAAITDIAGSSSWFDRGFVTYSNEAKQEMLGVNRAMLDEHGAVSEAVARQMAIGALQHSGADASVAVTGIAGPGGATPGKPVGLVWFAWATKAGMVRSRSERFDGDRAAVRASTVRVALEGLVEALR